MALSRFRPGFITQATRRRRPAAVAADPRRPTGLDKRLRTLKWLSIVIPAVGIFAFEMVRHQLIEPYVYSHHLASVSLSTGIDVGNLIVGAFAFVLAWIFGQAVFGVIERIQLRLLRRNVELETLNAVAGAVVGSLEPDHIVAKARSALARLFVEDEIAIDSYPNDQPIADEPLLLKLPDGAVELRQSIDRGASRWGVITIRRATGVFHESDRRLLGGVANMLGTALENARLHQQVRESAITTERARIAREMHDGVAQLLAFVLVNIGMVDDLVQRGDDLHARQELETLRREAERAYAEVREGITALRMAAEDHGDLDTFLPKYLADFEDQTGIRTRLELTCASLACLPDSAELQLVRILQEALANVRRHAQAASVLVRVGWAGDQLDVRIADDGIGFDYTPRSDANERRFGLSTMQERAESLGGRLIVRSAQGAGTELEVRIPIAGPAGAAVPGGS